MLFRLVSSSRVPKSISAVLRRTRAQIRLRRRFLRHFPLRSSVVGPRCLQTLSASAFSIPKALRAQNRRTPPRTTPKVFKKITKLLVKVRSSLSVGTPADPHRQPHLPPRSFPCAQRITSAQIFKLYRWITCAAAAHELSKSRFLHPLLGSLFL